MIKASEAAGAIDQPVIDLSDSEGGKRIGEIIGVEHIDVPEEGVGPLKAP